MPAPILLAADTVAPPVPPPVPAPAPVAGALDQVGVAANKVGTAAIDAANQLGTKATAVATKASGAAIDAAKQAGTVANDAAVQVGSAAKALKDVVLKATGTADAFNQLGAAADTALNKAGAALNSLGQAISRVFDSAGKSADTCGGNLTSIWTDLWSGSLGQAGNDAIGSLTTCSQSVSNVFKSLLAFFY